MSADTFENSEVKCAASNARWADLRTRFIAEGNLKRESLVPAEKCRNDNPADFQFLKLAVLQNESLLSADAEDEQTWDRLEDLLMRVRDWAATKASVLRLHPGAELGISGRRTWYHSAIRLTA